MKFKKGDAKTGGIKKGGRHTATILREMLAADAMVFAGNGDQAKHLQALADKGFTTAKEVLIYMQIKKAILAADGKAVEWIVKQIGEEIANKIEISAKIDYTKLTDEQLYRLANEEVLTPDELT